MEIKVWEEKSKIYDVVFCYVDLGVKIMYIWTIELFLKHKMILKVFLKIFDYVSGSIKKLIDWENKIWKYNVWLLKDDLKSNDITFILLDTSQANF